LLSNGFRRISSARNDTSRLGDAPPAEFQNDFFAWARLTLNYAQSTSLFSGAIVDVGTQTILVSVEASRRIGDRRTMELGCRGSQRSMNRTYFSASATTIIYRSASRGISRGLSPSKAPKSRLRTSWHSLSQNVNDLSAEELLLQSQHVIITQRVPVTPGA
jgi:hypothetical protein